MVCMPQHGPQYYVTIGPRDRMLSHRSTHRPLGTSALTHLDPGTTFSLLKIHLITLLSAKL